MSFNTDSLLGFISMIIFILFIAVGLVIAAKKQNENNSDDFMDDNNYHY